MTRYGQLVIGPPGSGKTTYCNAMYTLLTQLGRPVLVVNLDPANDHNRPNPCHICLSELTSSSAKVSQLHSIGPNAAILQCFDYLSSKEGVKWFLDRLSKFDECFYILIDCPGQLYSNHNAMRNLISSVQSSSELDLRLCAVNLADSLYCSETNSFVSLVLNCLNFMMHLELPTVNVFSKLDMLNKRNPQFATEMYTDVTDLKSFLTNNTLLLDDQSTTSVQCNKFLLSICDIIHDFSLVCFGAIDINNQETLIKLLSEIDRAIGFVQCKKCKKSLGCLELMTSSSKPQLYRRFVNETFDEYRHKNEDN